MRKVWCYCAAGMVAVAGVMVAAGVYTYRHPDSKMVRTARRVHKTTEQYNPFARLAALMVSQSRNAVQTMKSRMAADTAAPAEAPPSGSGCAASKPCAPAEPVQVFLEEPPPRLHGQIVIGQEEGCAPDGEPCRNSAGGVCGSVIAAPCGAVVGGAVGVGCGEPEEWEPCRPVMPLCQEPEQAPATIPHIEDEPPADSCESFLHFWMKFFEAKMKDQEPQECEQPDYPGCQEDPNPSYHCPHNSCPHSGVCPYSGKSVCPYDPTPPQEPDVPAEQGDNTQEPSGIPCEPKKSAPHPEVDTMEYRKSDATFDSFFGLIPF
jgi:hypothetical protein